MHFTRADAPAPTPARKASRDAGSAASELTLLYAVSDSRRDLTALPCFAEELDWEIDCHLGRREPSPRGTVLVSFQAPRYALRAAIALQRGRPDLRLRIALQTTQRAAASPWHHRRGRRRAEVEAAAAVAHRAAAGCIAVSRQTYESLLSSLPQEARGCLVAEEHFAGGEPLAMITPAPGPAAEYTTFAGLEFA